MSAARPPVQVERIERVLVATLARAPVNAIDAPLLDALEAVVDAATSDPDIAVLHVRSGLKTFCAGADLALMQSCFASAEGTEQMLAVVRRMQEVFARLEAAPVASVVEIGGAAVGGGLELALACDLRIAAVEAKLGFAEGRLGLLPAAGGTQRAARLCGEALAKRLILGAEIVDGGEAQRLGLVQWCVPRAQLAAAATELAARIAQTPRAAIAAAKACIAAAADPARDGFADEIAATRALYANPETRRRVAGFLQKTPA